MDDLKNIIKLLETQGKKISRIEKILESQQNKTTQSSHVKIDKSRSSSNKYKGLVGGISFLIDKRFFNKLVSVDEVHAGLKKEGYVYPYNSVDKVLRVDFVLKKKILVRDKENGIWKYALRK